MQALTITAPDGYRLSALFGRPVETATETVIISSATGIRKEFYAGFAHFLIMNGYNVLLFDYRGIGGSAPADLKSCDSWMHEWGTIDMNAVLDYVVFERKLTSIIWVGHSVGAQFVGFLRERQHITRVIAVSFAFGYWGYLPSPVKWLIWALWFFIGPLMTAFLGYGAMSRIGWGEDLPPNMMKQWRQWCLSKQYFTAMLKKEIQTDKFYAFTTPITAVYISDDYIANDKTVPLMLEFFPHAPSRLHKICVQKFTNLKVGHAGIFRKKFRNELWPELIGIIAAEFEASPVC